MGEYTPEEFDRQVAALRGTGTPKVANKKKADCSPAEWASNLDYMKSFSDANREKIRAKNQRWNLANRGKVAAKSSRYRSANRHKIRDANRRRKSESADYRLRVNLRSRLNQAVKGNFKSGSAVRDLGCTIAELWSHLESKFLPGMTRENMGTAWHLDHIYPMAKANLQDRPQFLAVNNWRNLQPLSPADNFAKNGSVSCEAQALFDQLCTEFA